MLITSSAAQDTQQAQEEVDNIQIEADRQQNRRRKRILRVFDALNVVEDEAAEDHHTAHANGKREPAKVQEDAEDAGDHQRQQPDKQKRQQAAQVAARRPGI